MALAVVAAGCSYAPAGTPVDAASAASIDLLAGDWAHFAGATVTAAGVAIRPLGRTIVRQDGGGGQPNPPLNLRGPHLELAGDFAIELTMQVGADAAYVTLYGEPPVIYDEWRRERHALRVGVVHGQLAIALWDDRADLPAVDRVLDDVPPGEVTVTIARTGHDLVINHGDRELARLDDRGTFDRGRVWFGAYTALGGAGFTLVGLRASGALAVASAPTLAIDHTDPNTLRELGARRSRPLPIGGALAAIALWTDDDYRALALAQLSMVTPENDMKPQFVHPQPDVYAFDEADGIVALAAANAIAVHAHTLVWHEALAPWMRQVSGAANVRRMMLDHVTTVATHFRGRVAEWDVINEPMSDRDADYTNGNRGLRDNLWFHALGESYIDDALRAARAADPDAKLFINEYGAEDDGARWDALVALVQRLQRRGVPLDGVGFQNHEYSAGDRGPAETFRKHVRALAALGLEVRVSEMDVLVQPTASGHRVQADELAGKLRVCRDEPNCSSFSTWGLTDRYGSTADVGNYPPAPGDALPFDTALVAKPAVAALRDALAR